MASLSEQSVALSLSVESTGWGKTEQLLEILSESRSAHDVEENEAAVRVVVTNQITMAKRYS